MDLRTTRALAQINDEGLFERLATAVLRLEPDYRALAQPGINAEGKTIKAPLDGITMTEGGEHLIAAHHTITAANGLRAKWLLDPAAVKRRKGTKSPSPAPGDVLKTLEIIRDERTRASKLRATLILTSIQEPDEQVIRDAVAAGRTENVAIDIWTRSRIAQRLDLDPDGQLIRRSLLKIEEELLSSQLVTELSAASIARFHACDPEAARVRRTIDGALGQAALPLILLSGGSGVGKTVAAHKHLGARAAVGEAAIVIRHETIEDSGSMSQAVMRTLVQLKPSLMLDQDPLRLFTPDPPAPTNRGREPFEPAAARP